MALEYFSVANRYYRRVRCRECLGVTDWLRNPVNLLGSLNSPMTSLQRAVYLFEAHWPPITDTAHLDGTLALFRHVLAPSPASGPDVGQDT